MNMSSIIKVVQHPKWAWSRGMLICPTFKPTQKVRVRYEQKEHNVGWLPVLEDKPTISCMSLLLIESEGTLECKDGMYVINNKYKSKDLSEIICEGLLDTWGDD